MRRLQENECWNYGESNYRLSGNNYDRLDVSWVGVGMSKSRFIQTIVESNFSDGGPTWIRDRVTESGNDLQVRLAKQHSGKVICIFDGLNSGKREGEILKILECVKI